MTQTVLSLTHCQLKQRIKTRLHSAKQINVSYINKWTLANPFLTTFKMM